MPNRFQFPRDVTAPRPSQSATPAPHPECICHDRPVGIEYAHSGPCHPNPLSEAAARNELAAVRLFFGIPDSQSVMEFLRCNFPRFEVDQSLPEGTAVLINRDGSIAGKIVGIGDGEKA